MDALIQLAASLLILAGLFYLHRRQLDKAHSRGWVEGQGDGYRSGYSANVQLEYHRGYVDGAAETRQKMTQECETRIRKQYDRGFNDALAAVKGETYAALLDEAETHLSA